MKLFTNLDEEDASLFRQWARDNYRPLSPIKGIWHPVVQAECVKINEEFNERLSDGGPEELQGVP